MQALLSWAAETRRASGVLDSHVYEDLESPAVFGFAVKWETPEALETHLRSERFGALLGALEVLADDSRLAITHVDSEGPASSIRARRRGAEGPTPEPPSPDPPPATKESQP